jgi:hypothetical protein
MGKRKTNTMIRKIIKIKNGGTPPLDFSVLILWDYFMNVSTCPI